METRRGRIGSINTGNEQKSAPRNSLKQHTMEAAGVTAEPIDLNSPPNAAEIADNSSGDSDFQKSVLKSSAQLIDGQNDLRNDIETFKKEITQTVEYQAEEISELQTSVKKLSETNAALKTTVDINADKLINQRRIICDVSDHVNRVERATRRNNIRIIGYPERDPELVHDVVNQIFSKFEFDAAIEVERAHRDGKRVRDGRTARPRHILVKLLRYTDKVNILKNSRKTLQSENYRIVDDLTKVDLDEKMRWKEEVSELYNMGTKLRFVGGMWRDRQGKPAPFYNKGGGTFPQGAIVKDFSTTDP